MSSAQLTTKQIMILLCFTVFGTIFFTLPRTIMQASGHSGWVSILVGSLMVLPLLWLISQIGSSMQEMSIIAYCLSLFGPFFGRVFALLILVPLVFLSGTSIRLVGELFVTLILPETPLEIIAIMLLVLRYYLAKGGMASIARWGEVVMPGVVVLIIIMFGLSFQKVDVERILPLLNASPMDVFRGSLAIWSVFSEISVLLFIYPQIKHKNHMFKKLIWCTIIVMFLFEVIFLVTIGTFGSAYTQRLMFPVVELIKDIAIFDFIEHLESIFLALWVFINVSKGALTFYACCIGTQDWFGTKDYKELMLPVSVIMFYISLLPDNIYVSIVSFEIAKGVTFCWYAFILLIIVWIAGKLKARRTANDQNT
ncbi:GerAB/ArcD/ProY family transporter [Paenibacillus qinlingensis]|uniref:GerAB/ArcD/ProY family transporter n=1 Tax=Paenibacillus qinlingensis TaxID=1837343 RepID=UPI00156332DB|nr:endospore germination permease [Paenibacillus qinlingensis]NQX63445.1 endospore germination permease [Paenibacillus qinlingensis]